MDAARAEMNLYTAIELNPNHQSLYKGSAEEDLAGVAPYLFTIKENTPFADWYFKEGFGKSWGILLFANAAFEDVYKHFRKFLLVKTEDGQQLYFRFYDPRVLRIFLPTCDSSQLKELIGPVRHFLVESEKSKEILQFWHENGILKTKVLPYSETSETETAVKQEMSEIEQPQNNVEPEDTSAAVKQEPKKRKWDFFLEE